MCVYTLGTSRQTQRGGRSVFLPEGWKLKRGFGRSKGGCLFPVWSSSGISQERLE